MLGSRVLHADETPVAMLDPGRGQDQEGLHVGLRARRLRCPSRAWCTTSASGAAAVPGEFLKGWSRHAGASTPTGGLRRACSSLDRAQRRRLRCPRQAEIRRTAQGQRQPGRRRGDPAHRLAVPIEADAQGIDPRASGCRCAQERSEPLWEELHVWLQLERSRVPDGSAIAKAIDYSLNRWEALAASCSMAMCRSTTTTSRTEFGPGLWDAAIGSSSAASWPASAPRS